jgi:hypothetical protein
MGATPRKERNWLRGFVKAAIAVALTGCTPQLHPTAMVSESPTDLAVMQQQLLAQLPTLERMACLSKAAYNFDNDNPDTGLCQQYEQGPGITMQTLPVQLHDVFGNPHQDYYKILIDNVRKEQIIAIRGTSSWEDWYTNIHIDPAVDSILNVGVHSGFRMYADDVYKVLEAPGGTDITGAPKLPLNRSYNTYVTGHSLGGAAAVILGLYLHLEKPVPYKIAGVYTFGQPKAFDNRGATSWPNYARKVYRAENCRDPVPQTPFGSNILSSLIVDPLSGKEDRGQYQHLGQEILLLDPGEYWMPANEMAGNPVSDIDAVYDALKAHQPIVHDIAEYIARIHYLRQMAAPGPQPTNPAYFFVTHCGPNSMLPES